MSIVAVVITLAAGLAITSLVLLVRAIRGKRLDDHPVCRRCSFDLIGVYPRADNCPECGCPLSESTIRVGRRRPRPLHITLGAASLAACVLLAASAIWANASNFNWNTIKPTWLLIREAEVADAESPALTELVKRVRNGTPSAATCRRLAATALDVQQNSHRPWVGSPPVLSRTFRVQSLSWCDLFEALHDNGNLSQPDRDRYLEQIVASIAIEFHPGPLRVDRGIPIVIGHSLPRMMDQDQQHYELWIREVALTSKGPTPLAPHPPGNQPVRLVLGGEWFAAGNSALSWRAGVMRYSNSVAAVAPAAPGRYEITAVYQVELRRGNPSFEEIIWTRQVPAHGVVEVSDR